MFQSMDSSRRRIRTRAIGYCTLDAPAATIMVHTATTLGGEVGSTEGEAQLVSVSVYDGATLLGTATLETPVEGVTPWSYDWTPGADGERAHTELHAVAHFSNADDATSSNVSTTADLTLDWDAVFVGGAGAGDAVFLSDRGITLTSEAVSSHADLLHGYTRTYPEGMRPSVLENGYYGRNPAIVFTGAECGDCTEAALLALHDANTDRTTLVCGSSASATPTGVLGGLFRAASTKYALYRTNAAKAGLLLSTSYLGETLVGTVVNAAVECEGSGTSVISLRSEGIVMTTASNYGVGVPTRFSFGARHLDAGYDLHFSGRVGYDIIASSVIDWEKLERLLCSMGYGPALDTEETLAWVWADSQSVYEATLADVCNFLRAQTAYGGAADIMWSCGDNVESGATAAQWTALNLQLRGVADPSGVSETLPPFGPTVGNHDAATGYEAVMDAAMPWRASLRGSDPYWTAVVNGRRWIALDDSAYSSAQTEWLDDTLDAATEPVCISTHGRIFCADTWTGDADGSLPWVRLFETYHDKIVAVFTGHVHLYEAWLVDGVRYFVSGRASAPKVCDPDPDYSGSLAYGGDTLEYDATTQCLASLEPVYASVLRLRQAGSVIRVDYVSLVGTAAGGYVPTVLDTRLV